MTDSDREYLRIPRDATFPTLPVPTDFQEYAFAYYLGAKELWEKTGKDQPNQVPMPNNLVFPILFMIHHFLELELKSGIELTYSIGHMTGEITDEQVRRSHDLNSLLTLMKTLCSQTKYPAQNLGSVVNLRISVSKPLFPSFRRKRETRIR